jgi:mannose/fructose/N-acetylgalactosamine-specific phosphotransferase system component IIC
VTAALVLAGGPVPVLAAAGAGLVGLPWPAVLLLALLAAVLSLDDTAFAQTWLGQPLPAGLLAGAVCGDPLTGLAVGLPFQLVTLGNLPVGQTFTGEKVAAVVAGVGGAILTGHALPPPAATVSGSAAGELGWVLAGVCLFSLAGHRVVKVERATHFRWMLEGHRTLWDGRTGRFEGLIGRCLAATALRGLLLCLLWLLLMVAFWMPLYALLPPRLVRALALLPLLAPPLAVAALGDLYGWGRAWRWIGGGLVTAAFAARWL